MKSEDISTEKQPVPIQKTPAEKTKPISKMAKTAAVSGGKMVMLFMVSSDQMNRVLDTINQKKKAKLEGIIKVENNTDIPFSINMFVIFDSKRCYSCYLSSDNLVLGKVNNQYKYKVVLSDLHKDDMEKYYRSYNHLLFSGIDQKGLFKVYITGRSLVKKKSKE